MRNSHCKKLRKYAKAFQKEWQLYTLRLIYKMIKKSFKKVPRNERYHYMMALLNDLIIIIKEQKPYVVGTK